MSNPDPAPPAAAFEDLEDLYENAPCGYLSLDPSGRIVKSNQTFSHWIGIAASELVGRKLHELLNIAGRVFYETHFAPLLRMQGFFNEVALDFITKDGAKLPVLANAMERRATSGDLLFTRLTIFKATDRRRYERELVDARVAAENARRELAALNAALEQRVANAVAERLMAEKGLSAEKEVAQLREQFIAVLGHDLRNPLGSIVNGLRLLELEPDSAHKNRLIGLMKNGSRRMSELIDNVLDLTRGRLGHGITVARDFCEPEPLLRQVIGELQLAHPDRVFESTFSIAGRVYCDRSRLGQLASNLLGNALVHGATTEPVRIGASTGAGLFELWVANGGEPIAEATMLRLFQPFFRGEVRDSRQGLGLGLYIAMEIAKAHAGALTVTSSAVETRFTFRMPTNPNQGSAG